MSMVTSFHTKLRRKLLAYTFTHVDESFYVRELSGLIGEDAGNLSRELRRLEEEGLFRSTTKGNLRIYSLNKTYSLFKELKEISFKTEGVEGSLKELIRQYRGISLAFIHGSYAKRTEGKASDVDVILVGRFPQNKLTRQIRDLEARLNREINFTAYSQEEFQKESQKAGGFLDLVLKDKIIILKGKRDGG